MAKRVITRVRETLSKEIKEKCYVCLNTIGKRKHKNIGRGVFRHESCEPGSEKWLKSKIGKRSKLLVYYKEKSVR